MKYSTLFRRIGCALVWMFFISTAKAGEGYPPDSCAVGDLCEEAILLSGVQSDSAFFCVQGCNLGAEPESINNPCGIGYFPTVWYRMQTDGAATLMNIIVSSAEFTAPTISLFFAVNGCDELQPVGLTPSHFACITGSNGQAEAIGTVVAGTSIYYIAVSSLDSPGGAFELCVNTIAQASACVTDAEIDIVSRSGDGPLEGPYLTGEKIGFCLKVNSYTAAGNGCQWFQGLVPVFGTAWDPASFDANGQPLNATVNGIPMGVSANGLYGTATWDWFADVEYHHDNERLQIGDFDGNGTQDLCHTMYDPYCPFVGGIIGGCCGPCWGDQPGDIMPGGWFAYGINGTCDTLGPPIRFDWGDGSTCGPGMGPWSFCFELTVRDSLSCEPGPNAGDLTIGFFTFSDGETGAWTGGASVCSQDQPIFRRLPVQCPLTSSETVRISQGRIRIYPNPVRDEAVVEWKDLSRKPIRYTIMGSNGALLESRQLTAEHQHQGTLRISLGALATGLYEILLYTDRDVLAGRFMRI